MAGTCAFNCVRSNITGKRRVCLCGLIKGIDGKGMKTGELIIIDERFFSGSPAASWDEYLVLERLNDGYKLDIRVYDYIGDISDYGYDEDDNPKLPDEIDGKKVKALIDDGIIIGEDLVQMTDDTPELVFKTPDQEILEGWLIKIKWNDKNAIHTLMKQLEGSN